jgi:hypothetical protein
LRCGRDVEKVPLFPIYSAYGKYNMSHGSGFDSSFSAVRKFLFEEAGKNIYKGFKWYMQDTNQ